MTRRDLAKLERQIKRAKDDRQRVTEFAEAGPSFVPVSDGDGEEKNGRLRQLHALNQHSSHPTERRKPGWPSTFGPLARRAQEQAETSNEARARLLRPTVTRLAQEAETMTEPSPGLPYWLGVAAIVVASVAIVVLALACVKLVLVQNGYIAP
jgi:hypothetical protein